MSFLSTRLPCLLCLSLAAAGCTTPQERAAQNEAEAASMMAIYGPACSRLGYALNSDAWRNCVVALSAKDDLRRYGPAPGYYPGWTPNWYGGGWGSYW